MNRQTIILDFDQSVGTIENAISINLTDWQAAVRFGCSNKIFHQLATRLQHDLPLSYGTAMLGSGDYHHISLLLIERLQSCYNAKNPIEVVIFDNHPDNMRYLFGIHCGSWVSYVAKLAFVSHVHVLGITSHDIAFSHAWENRLTPLIKNKLTYWSMDVDTRWANKLGLGRAFKHFATPDDLISAFLTHQINHSQPVYLSIDKDVLDKTTIQTNWDQGRLKTEHILTTIAGLSNRIIASDITGDVSNWQHPSRFKRLLSFLDKQPTIPLNTLKQWQAQQHQVNLQLLSALQAPCHFS
ncbi:arginase family protein [Orbus sturtevantii]|uniref:hypothetical protein n=1 Tax=Orbus sturtevantii TaxID=3074109 RepID=UPI00370DD3DC